MMWRAETRPRMMSYAPPSRNHTGTISVATYPYTATSSPTVISPAAAMRAASHTTIPRNSPGIMTVSRLDPAVDRADPVPLGPQALGPVGVAASEQVAPAHPGEDPEPGHDVARPGGQLTLLAPVDRLGPFEPAQRRPHQQTDHRYPEHDDHGQDR